MQEEHLTSALPLAAGWGWLQKKAWSGIPLHCQTSPASPKTLQEFASPLTCTSRQRSLEPSGTGPGGVPHLKELHQVTKSHPWGHSRHFQGYMQFILELKTTNLAPDPSVLVAPEPTTGSVAAEEAQSSLQTCQEQGRTSEGKVHQLRGITSPS